jgi:hypothetical protein
LSYLSDYHHFAIANVVAQSAELDIDRFWQHFTGWLLQSRVARSDLLMSCIIASIPAKLIFISASSIFTSGNAST